MENALLERLHQALRDGWSANTSADAGAWSVETPSWRQCAVTACVVQDLLGGEILWATATTPDAERHSHYFNRLPDGTVLDLTRDQFPAVTEFAPPEGCLRTANSEGRSFPTTRDYILSYPATLRRYERLRAHVRRLLGR